MFVVFVIVFAFLVNTLLRMCRALGAVVLWLRAGYTTLAHAEQMQSCQL